MDYQITVGPFGGNKGDSWDDGINRGIKQIVVVYGDIIDSICIQYYDNNGQSVPSGKHGGSGGTKTGKVELDFPNEYLTEVSGFHAMYVGGVVINSLKFQSNKGKKFGPYGPEKGDPFSFSTSLDKKMVGFWGTSGVYLDSIGAHLQHTIGSYGPFGGKGGTPWDDEINTGIKQIQVGCGQIIHSICIEYDNNGRSKRSKHGGDGGRIERFELDFPNEYLTSISGYYTHNAAFVYIHSLVFQSNKKQYGPYGDTQKGEQFLFPTSGGGKIVGFHGRSGGFLDSIGAYVEKI